MKKMPINALYYIFVKFLLMSPLFLLGQERVFPVGGDLLLSGNFGELRATHFHSGIDIKTGGKEGLPVRNVKDGIVARVSVSPTGYGYALYMEHADGTTTVYGHLQRFEPRLAEVVRDLQYAHESFKIDVDLHARHLFYQAGDTLAYSGNTGSSGGPHLHFEVRNTRTEHTLNPLRYYPVKDRTRPVVKRLYLYGIGENGMVRLLQSCPVERVSAGMYDAGHVVVPSGRIGIGVFAMDYMEGSWNKLGIYRLALAVGQDTVFAFSVDSCSFDHSRLVNEVKDFHGYKRQETVYRCFGHYHEQLFGVVSKAGGSIKVLPDSLVKVSVSLADINGNHSSVRLCLEGGEEVARDSMDGDLLFYDKSYVLKTGRWQVELDSSSLFSSVARVCEVEYDDRFGDSLLVLAREEVPLLKRARLFVRGNFCPQALVCEVTPNGRCYPLATSHTSKGLEASVPYLARYGVAIDTVAPKITYEGKVAGSKLRFRIKDDFSGITDYKGEVNGRWCLFSYDPRTAILQCSLGEPAFVRGEWNTVCVVVKDLAGNKRELKIKVLK